MTMVLFIIAFAIAFTISTLAVYHYKNEILPAKNFKALYGTTKEDVDTLSWASKEIFYKYHKLPESHRPSVDILSVVKALDAKYGKKAINDHYISAYGRGNRSWTNCECRYANRRRGPCMDFYPLYKTMENLIETVREQEHALKMHSLAGDLDAAKELCQKLRQERELVSQVTKELTSD